MEDAHFRRALEPQAIKRTDGRVVPLNPTIIGDERTAVRGSEVEVMPVILDYKKSREVSGLVYKDVRSNDLDQGRTLTHDEKVHIMHDMLDQWREIIAVKKQLTAEAATGFNIPGTVRGVEDHEHAGILMTDLTENGKYELVDIKNFNAYLWEHRAAPHINADAVRKIRDLIAHDIDIAAQHGIKLITGFSNHPLQLLDTWQIAINKQTGELKIYICDIGRFSSKKLDPMLDRTGASNDPTVLRERGLKALAVFESEAQQMFGYIAEDKV